MPSKPKPPTGLGQMQPKPSRPTSKSKPKRPTAKKPSSSMMGY